MFLKRGTGWASHKAVALLPMLGLGLGFSLPAFATSLEEAVSLAIETHPSVLSAKADARAAEQQISSARGGFFPSVDFEGDTGYEYANNTTTRGAGDGSDVETWRKAAGLTLTQPLFDGLSTWYAVEAAQSEAAASRQEIADARQTVALRAVEAYVTVLRNRLVLELAQENVDKHRDVVADVRLRADSGAGSLGDVNQAVSRLALAEARLIEVRGTLRESEADYNEAVGVMPEDLSAPEDVSDFPVDVQDALDVAIQNNPSLQAAGLTTRARAADRRAAYAPFMPELDLELSETREHNTGGARNLNIDRKAVVVMRYNFFNGGTDWADSKRASQLERAARFEEGDIRRRIERQLRIDFSAYETATDRLGPLSDRALASADAVIAYRKQFEIGRRSLLDALDVENELFQAKVALVDGDLQEKLSRYRVLTTMGELTGSLGVGDLTGSE